MLLKEQCEKPQSVYFQRAARTDKGVSAIKQTLSCNLPVNFIEEIAKINEHLPNQIRLIAAKRATKNFDAKNYCDARTYAYMMPSYTLTLPDELTSEQFRINDERLKKFNLILNSFKGVHNFHNFTSQKSPTDVSAMRYIIDIECGQPFVKDNIEFVIVRVKGQSFMLHQIRKMIGLVIGIMRGFANIDIIEKCFLLDRIDIPKAPGLGLMLEEVHYDKYNYRYGGNGIHEKITWDEYHDTIEKFKHEFIYPVIVQTEGKELSMLKWLQRLPVHTFDVRQIDPSKNNELNDTNLEDMSKEELFNNINSKRTLYYGSYVNAGLFTSSSNKFVSYISFSFNLFSYSSLFLLCRYLVKSSAIQAYPKMKTKKMKQIEINYFLTVNKFFKSTRITFE